MDVTIWLIVLTIALVTLYPLIRGKRRARPARALLAFETQRDYVVCPLRHSFLVPEMKRYF